MAAVYLNFSFHVQRSILHVMTVQISVKKDVVLLLYLHTVINHQLWKLRNNCVHENARFDHQSLISKVIRSVGSRKNFQQKMISSRKKIPRIDELFTSMVTLKNITFDNG